MRDVTRFRYETRLTNATYRLDLTKGAARLDLTLTAPYVVNVVRNWERVIAGSNEYTTLLERTTAALEQLITDTPRWHHMLLATEQGATLSAYTPLTIPRLTTMNVGVLRGLLPVGITPRTKLTYP